MGSTRRLVGGLLLCLVVSFLISVLVAFTSITSPCSSVQRQPPTENACQVSSGDDPSWGAHRLAVIVPLRDRFEELVRFVPHIHGFLNDQKVRHKIYVVNQVDHHRFNRASLINVGHLLSRQECDYLAMHDVDLLPVNKNLSYAYPARGPHHVASPSLHPRYHYSTFVGGILLLTREHFEKVNGLSNKYWGWGLEDDEFYARMKEARLNITRPEGITTGMRDTFLHLHNRAMRKRDTARLFNQKEATRRRDKQTGLSTVEFEVASQNSMTIDGAPLVLYHVRLKCNYSLTPWCDLKPSLTPPRDTKSHDH